MSNKPQITDHLRAAGPLLWQPVIFVIAANIWPQAMKTLLLLIFLVPLGALIAVISVRACLEAARMVRVLGNTNCPGCGLQFGIQTAKQSRKTWEDVWVVACHHCDRVAYFDTDEEALIDLTNDNIEGDAVIPGNGQPN